MENVLRKLHSFIIEYRYVQEGKWFRSKTSGSVWIEQQRLPSPTHYRFQESLQCDMDSSKINFYYLESLKPGTLHTYIIITCKYTCTLYLLCHLLGSADFPSLFEWLINIRVGDFLNFKLTLQNTFWSDKNLQCV